MKKLSDMSLQELEDTKKKWYIENHEIINNIIYICRILGNNINAAYGPKYRLLVDDIDIYVDDYGHYALGHVEKKLTMSTHNEQLFVPGEWVSKILSLYEKAKEKEKEKNKLKNEEERQFLLNQLTIPFESA